MSAGPTAKPALLLRPPGFIKTAQNSTIFAIPTGYGHHFSPKPRDVPGVRRDMMFLSLFATRNG